MYKALFRPFFFLFQPEKAHKMAMSLLRIAFAFPGIKVLVKNSMTVSDPKLEKTLFGITFPNPIGLAAGFDKNAEHIDNLDALGFGFIEIGTVTPRAQPGNPKPRMFRLPEDKGLINRMGFNNEGVQKAKENLAKRKSKVIIGGNIGKNKITPNEDAVKDYLLNFDSLFPVVDYFVVNVSSPNTPGLRELQDKKPLTKILQALQDKNKAMPLSKPILLKIAPDLTNAQLDDIVEIVSETDIDGIIATNTTIERTGLVTTGEVINEQGGLSGAPVTKRSTEVIRYLHDKSNGTFPIIGVGGILTAQDAIEKLEAGASLVQVYTGFIYEGPGMIKKLNKGLLKYLS